MGGGGNSRYWYIQKLPRDQNNCRSHICIIIISFFSMLAPGLFALADYAFLKIPFVACTPPPPIPSSIYISGNAEFDLTENEELQVLP